MVRRSGRSCPGWNTGRVATSITGVKTPIAPRASASIACKGSSPRDMPSAFCPRMDPLLNTFVLDGICCPRRRTAKRCGSDSRVGLKLQGRSGPPKGPGGPGRGTRLPDEHLSLNNLTKPPTGLAQLDNLLGGLTEGLYLLAGAPGMGKTTLALQVAVAAT